MEGRREGEKGKKGKKKMRFSCRNRLKIEKNVHINAPPATPSHTHTHTNPPPEYMMPALLSPQPKKNPLSSGASPINGRWSAVKDSGPHTVDLIPRRREGRGKEERWEGGRGSGGRSSTPPRMYPPPVPFLAA